MVVNVKMAREVCSRLPLAEACLRLLDLVSHDDFLAEVFERYRGRSYEKVISFPTFVHLIADSLLENHQSARQSFRRAQQEGDLKATLTAAYGKLARIPICLSKGFLFETSQRLQAIFPKAAWAKLPPSLADMQALAIDGKKIKHVAKRLKALRAVRGQVLGAKLVVALWLNTGLAVALDADPDGEVSDAPLVPEVLLQTRSSIPGPRLWLADAQFCDLNQPALLGAEGDHFILRNNAKVGFHADPERPAVQGSDETGRNYRQEWGWIGQAKDPRRCYVRRITLFRPGEADVILLTDLLDAEQYPAADLLDAYLMRWGIETCFQRITEVFDLRNLIGGTPEATVYQASFCLLLYNVIVVARGYVAEAEQLPAEEISLGELFSDVQRQLIAWNEVLKVEETVTLLQGQPAEPIQERLRALLGGVWTERWRKTPKRKRQPIKKQTEYLEGGHSSVFRLVQKAKAREPVIACSNSS
jgi:Transposase DDE domain